MQEFCGLIKSNTMLRLPLPEAKHQNTHLVEFIGIVQMIEVTVNLVTT